MAELDVDLQMAAGSSAARLTIAEIETIAVRVPLGQTYRGSRYEMTHRSTIVTRIRTEEGIVGEAYCGDEDAGLLEIDEILMDHPAVAQVVTFGMPHEKLGEEVAAAVVLREGMTAVEAEIREFCGKRLADFKVPRKIVILAEIPKGATGKLQRIGLAQKLGLG